MRKTTLVYFVFICFAIRYLSKAILHIDTVVFDLFIYAIVLYLANFRDKGKYLVYLVILSCLILFNVEAIRVCLIVLLCFISTDINIKKLALVNTITGFFMIGTVFYLLHTGILTDESYVAYNVGDTIRERHSLGIGYNRFSILFFSVILNLYIILSGRLNKYLLSVLCVSLVYWCYTLTGSNTAFVGGLGLAFFNLLYSIKITKKIFEKRIVLFYAPLFLLILTIVVAFLSDKLPVLNLIFTSRPHFTLSYLYTITPIDFLLGDANNMVSKDFYVDSSHIHLLFEGGIVFYLFFYNIYIKAMKYFLFQKKQDTNYNDCLIPVVFASMVIGLTECTLLEVSMIGNAIFWAILFNYAFKYDKLKRQCI